MNHTCLCKTEKERLRAQVDELLRAAEESDTTDDAQYGKGKRGDDLPKELHSKEDRVGAIPEAKLKKIFQMISLQG